MTRRRWLLVVALAWGAARASGQPPVSTPPPASTPRGTAADGTSSVVVPATDTPLAAPGEMEGTTGTVNGAGQPPQPNPAAVPSEPAAAAPAGIAPSGGAAALLAAVLEPLDPPPVGIEGLYARPLPLLEALQRPADPSRRLWIAQAYWRVSTGYAWLRWSAESLERLEMIAPGGDPHDRAVLDVATAAARADLTEARSQLGLAQQELVDLTRLPIGEPLPWPVDRPLASPYQTHFDAIFATRMATGRTRAIARTLPMRHEALESRAAAVAAADKALALAEADHARGKRPIEAVIAAHAALVGQEREFLAAVRAYNLDIAEYAMAVADTSAADETFVSMLIGTPIVQPRTPPIPGGGPGTPAGTAAAGGGVTP